MVWLFWGVDSGYVVWTVEMLGGLVCCEVWTVEMLGGLVVLRCGQWRCYVVWLL